MVCRSRGSRAGLALLLTLAGLSGLSGLSGPTGAEERHSVPPPRALDISAVRDDLVVFTDNKGHYIASRVQPVKPAEARGHIYYGDGKVFYQQYTSSIGGSREYFNAAISEPRVLFGAMSSYTVRDGQATFTCEDRKTTLTPLPLDKGRAMLKKAKIYSDYWTRTPHALARDDEGRYYYVDRLARKDDNPLGSLRGYRVFVGERGKLKLLKMKNMVSDVRGEVFITREGKLRLILTNSKSHPKPEKAQWLEGKTRQTELVIVPIENPRTRVMIFRELGVYQGLRLHKPCDDW